MADFVVAVGLCGGFCGGCGLLWIFSGGRLPVLGVDRRCVVCVAGVVLLGQCRKK